MKKTQKEKILEVAFKNDYKEVELEDQYARDGYDKVCIEKDNKGLILVFDNDGKFCSSVLSTNQLFMSLGPDKFKNVINFIKPLKLYGKVEWVDEDSIVVGAGATLKHYTDCDPYTVVEVINENRIVARKCKATLSQDFKLNFVPGGFSAHCTNNYEQEYDYIDDLDAPGIVFTKRKNGRWYKEGESSSSSELKIGYRRKFYDYNF